MISGHGMAEHAGSSGDTNPLQMKLFKPDGGDQS